jgi:hypothetical protein
MSVRTLLLGFAACAAAAPAFAATTPDTAKPMKHSMATHASMSHKGHMMAKGKTMAVSPDNSADELNARSLQNAHGTGGTMPAPMTPPKSGGGT